MYTSAYSVISVAKPCLIVACFGLNTGGGLQVVIIATRCLNCYSCLAFSIKNSTARRGGESPPLRAVLPRLELTARGQIALLTSSPPKPIDYRWRFLR